MASFLRDLDAVMGTPLGLQSNGNGGIGAAAVCLIPPRREGSLAKGLPDTGVPLLEGSWRRKGGGVPERKEREDGGGGGEKCGEGAKEAGWGRSRKRKVVTEACGGYLMGRRVGSLGQSVRRGRDVFINSSRKHRDIRLHRNQNKIVLQRAPSGKFKDNPREGKNCWQIICL